MYMGLNISFVLMICILLVQQSNGVYTVGDFMTRKENLHDEEGESTYRLRARLQLCEHISKEA